MLTGIVAMTKDQKVMGRDNRLPWHLPNDLKFFKLTTLDHRIIMGRKTFASFGGRPLPRREHWVLSSTVNENETPSTDLQYFKSKEQILEKLNLVGDHKQNFIIGGAQVFKLFWEELTDLLVTWIEPHFDGDIVFPDVNLDEFRLLTERREIDPFPHSFCHLSRR